VDSDGVAADHQIANAELFERRKHRGQIGGEVHRDASDSTFGTPTRSKLRSARPARHLSRTRRRYVRALRER
jgi:hypothetical protein